MGIPDNAIILAIDVGGHRHRFVKTDQNAKLLDQRQIANEVTTDEAGELIGMVDKSSEFIRAVRDMFGQEPIDGIVMGSAGPPNKDGTFGFPGEYAITTLPTLADAFNVPLGKCAWTNDCTAGAITAASPWGHQRQSFTPSQKPKAVAEGGSLKFRRRQRRGDETREDYSKVVYTTLSSSMNEGYITIVEIPGKGKYYIIDKGEFQATPEAGHQYYKERDPFGNTFQCFCGGKSHLESALAGGLGVNGISGIMLKAVSSGKIHSGPIYDAVQSIPGGLDLVGNFSLAPKLYAAATGTDESADKLKASVVEAVAHRIGYYWGVLGAGKVEFGGGMMHSYEQILIPAIEMVLEDPGEFAMQAKDFSTFPDVAVAEKCGEDHIWKGPLFMLLHKDRFLVTGEENFSQTSLT